MGKKSIMCGHQTVMVWNDNDYLIPYNKFGGYFAEVAGFKLEISRTFDYKNNERYHAVVWSNRRERHSVYHKYWCETPEEGADEIAKYLSTLKNNLKDF